MGNFQHGRLGRQLWTKTRTEWQQLTMGKLMKYQCHAALLMIRLLRTIHRQKLTARWRETEFQMSYDDWIHAKETFLDVDASSIHGSEKCVDTKTVLDWFGALVLKKTTSGKFYALTALYPCALYTLHTLLLRHCHYTPYSTIDSFLLL